VSMDQEKKDEENTSSDRESSDSKKDDLAKAVTEMKISSSKKSNSEQVIIEANGTSYECVARSGKGSFGVVYKAVEVGTNPPRIVAIKRVLQDPRYKNRELQIMRMVDHPNTVSLLDSFYERSKKDGEVYLNLVLEYIPKNLYEVSSSYTKKNEKMPIEHIQLYIYQLCRSLAYVHSLGICHRDIKPQNLLINPTTHELKLCDFGSAKILIKGEPNVSYICSRYYRAPELIFGASDYATAIDVWSSGCVMAELIMGQPIFAGDSGIDQLVEIIKVLGTPTREEIRHMNRDYKDYKQFPSIRPHPWYKLFPAETPKEAMDLMSKMLVYTPQKRIKPLGACAHAFFDDLRKTNSTAGSSASKLPQLFELTPEELTYAHKRNILDKIVPPEKFQFLPTRYKTPPEPQKNEEKPVASEDPDGAAHSDEDNEKSDGGSESDE